MSEEHQHGAAQHSVRLEGGKEARRPGAATRWHQDQVHAFQAGACAELMRLFRSDELVTVQPCMQAVQLCM